MAKKASVTPAAITQLESGKREPSLETLKKLASALSVEINYLVGQNFKTSGEQAIFRNLTKISENDRKILMDVYNRLKKE